MHLLFTVGVFYSVCWPSRVEFESVPARPAGRVQASNKVCLLTAAKKEPQLNKQTKKYHKRTQKSIHHRLSPSIFFLFTSPNPKNSSSTRHCTPLAHKLTEPRFPDTDTDTRTPNSFKLVWDWIIQQSQSRELRNTKKIKREIEVKICIFNNACCWNIWLKLQTWSLARFHLSFYLNTVFSSI